MTQTLQKSRRPIVTPKASRPESADAVEAYQTAPGDRKAEIVRDIYQKRDGAQRYATSPDFNLRELEIAFIADNLTPGKVLDVGCGNGYTLLSLARRFQAEFIGLDFSTQMLDGARKLMQEFAADLKSTPVFQQCDVRRLPFEDSQFDCAVSERCLQNLPSREDQFKTIVEVHRVLKKGGTYVMVEGTDDGLARLNEVREQAGLSPIPATSEDNVSALRFQEKELEEFVEEYFKIETVQFFGTYYLISRVVHPLLVAPEQPRFDAKINAIARQIAEIIPDVGKLGHVVGYKLRKR